MTAEDELWVFGYGSLMWRPGFPYQERRTARLYGYHRALCVHSDHHRGTPDRMGLVVGLDRGGSCVGKAYRVAPEDRDNVIAYLDARELPTEAYVPAECRVYMADRHVTARCYVTDIHHPKYAGKLPLEDQARIVLSADPGHSGINIEYVENLIAHLDELGITDGPLHRVWALLNSPHSRSP